MIKNPSPLSWCAPLIALAGFLGFSAHSQAEALLRIDVSNPSHVTIAATGAFSGVNNEAFVSYDGIDLLRFFTPGSNYHAFSLSGNLSAPGCTPYDSSEGDWYSSPSTALDLNLWREGALDIQKFSTSTAAFSGMSAIDASAAIDFLPSIGASGDILIGSSYGNDGTIIGTWEVVPEPASWALAGMGALGALLLRRRLAVGAKSL